MAQNLHIDCSQLASRTDFESYISAVRTATGNNFTLVAACKPAVCNALWGSGNADISGIGMLVGYILSNVLGFAFALILYTLRWRPTTTRFSSRSRFTAKRAQAVFFDSAIFFCFAIQTAAIVVLARLNFGVTASGMGDITVKITWAISVLTMLPPMYAVYIPTQVSQALAKDDGVGGCSSAKKSLEKSREELRFSLFVLCWLLSVYPFLSRMITNFGASKIGEGEESVISFADWDIIQAACYTNVDRLSSAEELAIKVFGVAGSLFLSLIVVLRLIWLAVQRQHTETKLARNASVRLQRMAGFWTVLLLVVLPLIAITQAWTVLRLQWLQARMADVVGNADTDGQWTFGQVVSVTLFAPVFVECWFHWRFEGQ